MTKTIFIDCDGVLADFVGGVRDMFGMPETWHPKEYDFSGELGTTWGEITKRIDRDKLFMASLEICADGAAFLEKLLEFAGHIDGARVVPLTTPMVGVHGWCDAREFWLASAFPELPLPIFAYDKTHVAGPGKLLVDDHDGNVDAWREAGGTAILWPRPWNSARILGPDERTIIMMLDQIARFINEPVPNPIVPARMIE